MTMLRVGLDPTPRHPHPLLVGALPETWRPDKACAGRGGFDFDLQGRGRDLDDHFCARLNRKHAQAADEKRREESSR